MFDPSDPTEVEDYEDYEEGCNALEGMILAALRMGIQLGACVNCGLPHKWIWDRRTGGWTPPTRNNICYDLFAESPLDRARVNYALSRLAELNYAVVTSGCWRALDVLDRLARIQA